MIKYLDLVNNYNEEEVEKMLQAEDKKLQESYKPYYKSLGKRNRNLIKNYAGNYNVIINSFLINQYHYSKLEFMKPYIIKNEIKRMNKMISNARLPQNITIYRGTNLRDLKQTSIIKGSTIKSLTIYSTSLNPYIASRFGRLYRGRRERDYIILEMDLPIDYPALYIEPYAFIEKEYEFLINNDSAFEIMDEANYTDYIYDHQKGIPVKIIKLKPTEWRK